MNVLNKLFVFGALGLLLAACGGGTTTVTYEEEYYTTSEPSVEFRQFDIVDTYGTSSEFSPVTHLAISPYVNFGEFDLLWNILSYHDYWIDVRINTSPNLVGSQLVSSSFCGPGLPCDIEPYLACEYTDYFEVSCQDAEGNVQSADIDHLIHHVPQTLYFILDVCDYSYSDCEYQAIPVLME